MADKSFKLPKIPHKNELPPVQLAMAEIIEDTDKIIEDVKIFNAVKDEVIGETESEIKLKPELNQSNASIAFNLFAQKQKVSLISLIKLLIPSITDKQVTVTMTKQQEEFIGEIKIDWQTFLKHYFKDNDITLNFNIEEMADTKRQAYTASEQYEEMLKNNELFRKMVNQFKLKLK